ncbi:STAS domain-containing protein [Streptomyces achromogenes]|uniref:STAS domain-containing protein n=1 Tax=Streptomyces achromogenes TaxID=67255 RepID=UPI0027D8D742|nr:STAS domain-containing protein [Streptomyces achromogenes]
MSDIGNTDGSDRFSAVHRMVDGVRVVTIEGEIDHHVRELLSAALPSGCGAAPPSRIVVDLGGVTFMDSTGINILITAYQAASATEGWLRVAAAQEPVLHVMQLVGIDALIACYPSVEQALTS